MKTSALMPLSILGLLTAGAVSRSYFVEERLAAGAASAPTESIDAPALEDFPLVSLGDLAGSHFIEPPGWGSFSEMHDFYVEAFVKSEGFGVGRIITTDT